MARSNNDEATVCRECAGQPKRRPRLHDKSETVDRDEDDVDEEREEFRDAFLDYYGRDAE